MKAEYRAAVSMQRVTSARQILRQHHIPRAQAPHGAIAHLDLDLARQGDHVLAPRGRMPVLDVAGRRPAKHDAGGSLKSRCFGGPDTRERKVHVLEVRLAVLSRVQANDLHRLVSGHARMRS